MRVLKRDSRFENIQLDKITERIRKLSDGYNICPVKIAIKTVNHLYDGVSTEELDKISAKVAESFKIDHPDYSIIAARILISNLHKTTSSSFAQCMQRIYESTDMFSKHHYDFIQTHAAALDAMIIHQNDYMFDYFGYKTLEYAYLLKIKEVEYIDDAPIYIDTHGHIIKNAAITFNELNKPTYVHSDGNTEVLHIKMKDRITDRPQYMHMRCAIAMYMDSQVTSAGDINKILKNIKDCYMVLSAMYFTHATPTLYNSCMKNQQLLSCFLLGTNDSATGIMKNVTDCALISKCAGGIGVHMSNIRSNGQLIRGTGGGASGIPQELKIYNEVARTFDQGGRRPGAFAIYVEPWHGDIMAFLKLKLNQGDENLRAKDLFYALWLPDLFMQRCEKGLLWSLFSEDTAPGLSELYDGMDVCDICDYCTNRAYAKYVLGCDCILNGTTAQETPEQNKCVHNFKYVDVFTEIYTRYEREGRAVGVIRAREVIDAIFHMQRESGTPYICFKDTVNRCSGQKNVGTIKSSNLCSEIVEWSNDTSYACCTLASINLKKFIVKCQVNDSAEIDHEKLHKIVRIMTRNLDIINDKNIYPVPECAKNSEDYRNMAIGVQGLADVFAIMRIPFLSAEAARIDLEIFETIYHAALEASCKRARKLSEYSQFAGSPASMGELQFDLWRKNQTDNGLLGVKLFSGRYDWDKLKQEIIKYGLRNSHLVALMPTVSTSQILGNNESFEPFHSNIYTKNTQVGKYTIINKYMIQHLIELGIWDENIKSKIIDNNGSLSDISEIPQHVREIYKTCWEIKQIELIKRAAIRGAFIDQSQSLNIHSLSNEDSVLRGIMFAGYKYKLKTGSYYIRTKPAARAMKNNLAKVVDPVAVGTSGESNNASCTWAPGCNSCNG